MSNKKTEQKINIIRDERNHIWTSFLVTMSGSLALIIQFGYNLKSLLGILGLIIAVLLFIIYLKRSIELDNLIKKIKEKEKD